MRIVFIGASEVTERTAELLIAKGHEVIIIEKQQDKIDQLSERLDCSFLAGDGSNPEILAEVSPSDTHVLFCLSNNDQDNIIAGLVGRSLGFQRVVPSIQNPAYESICMELGLADTIIPSRTISRFLADIIKGTDPLELSTALRDKARVFSITLEDADISTVADLELPESAKAVCLYRQGSDFELIEDDTKLNQRDEVIVLTDSETLPELRDRWAPEYADNAEQELE